MRELSEMDARGDPEFMTSLARGLAVMRCFADERQPMTIAQASRLTGLSRPAVKRCLHTMERLGYVAREGVHYQLRPKVLSLGYAYLSSSTLAVRAQPILDAIRDDLHESCSLGVIEEDEVTYIARAEVSRIMSIALRVGSRLPLYCTSMGRILLAGQERSWQEAYFARTAMRELTATTQTSPGALLGVLRKVAEDGYAIVDQELEPGLRSVAVPVHKAGRTIAALNIGTQSARVAMADLHSRYLPVLRRAARELEALV
ncbi:helix-turn-helix domain-containing protein [Novosphingobium sp. 1949]|uniref:Helix-turn-helix domain-containing protein n=1 Tax=Novosphingobium organovorum TaxID=2930092 RepID=A0ABT0BI03_9SPHN|nr:IclR family transcriptional regulator C-terminal domain-containing protein [Novosphingobium organovorum]MCJ2184687.1 helix-turn-helix domain-containing protein [Novosphingobium organovorum]